MLGRIARHEWRMLFSEKTPWIILFLLAASIGYAIVNGLQWTRFQQATLGTAFAEQKSRYADLKQQVTAIEAGKKPPAFADPRMPDAVGGRLASTYAAMPPLPLSPLSIGQSDVLPYYFKISTASKESVLTSNEIENPNRLLSGRFDLSFVVIYLFPLLITALSYNLLSSEQEQGTLALLLSQPVPLRTFMAGKIGLRAAVIIGVAVLFSLAGLTIAGIDMTSPEAVTRLLIWTGVVAAYAVFWFGVVLFITSFGRGSATNAMAVAATWLVLVVVLPSTLNMAASVLYPMPSRVDMIAALRTASDEASAKGNQLLAKYYGDHPELVSVTDSEKALNDVAVTRLAIDDEIERRVRPVADRYDIQLASQQRLVDRFRLFSPAIVAQDALNDVAGTGAAQYRHFVSLVEEYHKKWQSLFSPMIIKKQRFTSAMYDNLPQFEFLEEPLREVIARTGGSVAELFLSGLILAAIGVRRLSKFSITG
jgi:ABC-2 type transport system permease protein